MPPQAVLVLSGKGGVGKSTVAVHLARALVRAGRTVGILDVDLTGPSVPRLCGVRGASMEAGAGGAWVPVWADGARQLGVVSVEFLMADTDAAVVWRGPKKTTVIRQLVDNAAWAPGTDFIVIDFPPGTSDEHLACYEALTARPDKFAVAGAVLVTTPQLVSVDDARREVSFCRTIGLPLLGIIENMSGFRCPCCGDVTGVFAAGGGSVLANEQRVKFFGTVPIDPRVAECEDAGTSFFDAHPGDTALQALERVADALNHKRKGAEAGQGQQQ